MKTLGTPLFARRASRGCHCFVTSSSNQLPFEQFGFRDQSGPVSLCRHMAHGRRFPYLPPRIEGLASLAMNISWSWSRSARSLFASIDEPLWHFTRHNPIMVLRRVHPERLSAVARDPAFLEVYDRLMQKGRSRANEPRDVVRQTTIPSSSTARSRISVRSSGSITPYRSTRAALAF